MVITRTNRKFQKECMNIVRSFYNSDKGSLINVVGVFDISSCKLNNKKMTPNSR